MRKFTYLWLSERFYQIIPQYEARLDFLYSILFGSWPMVTLTVDGGNTAFDRPKEYNLLWVEHILAKCAA